MAIISQTEIKVNSLDEKSCRKNRQVWQEKGRQLAGIGRELEPYEHYKLIYGQDYDKGQPFYFGKKQTLYNELGEEYKTHNVLMPVDVAFAYASTRADFYSYACSVECGSVVRVSYKTHREQYAIVLDLDGRGDGGVTPANLKQLIADNWRGYIPTTVVNSGSGLHLVYCLKHPQKAPHIELKAIIKGLADVFSDLVDVVSLTPVHAFRVVGSLTKYGDIVTSYRLGGLWDYEKLKNDFYTRQGLAKQAKQEKQNVAQFPHGVKGYYSWLKNQLWERGITEGHRHMSLLALVTMGDKAGYSREVLRGDVEALAKRFNIPANMVNEVMNLRYNSKEKAITVKSTTLEEWLGWKFPRAKKRRAYSERLTRQENIKKVHSARANKTHARIHKYLKNHPKATNKQVALALKISIDTVKRYKAKNIGTNHPKECSNTKG